jgi:hypothetical protein
MTERAMLAERTMRPMNRCACVQRARACAKCARVSGVYCRQCGASARADANPMDANRPIHCARALSHQNCPPPKAVNAKIYPFHNQTHARCGLRAPPQTKLASIHRH